MSHVSLWFTLYVDTMVKAASIGGIALHVVFLFKRGIPILKWSLMTWMIGSTSILGNLHIDKVTRATEANTVHSSFGGFLKWGTPSYHPKVVMINRKKQWFWVPIFQETPIYLWTNQMGQDGRMSLSMRRPKPALDSSCNILQGLRFERDHRLSQQLWVKKCADLRFVGLWICLRVTFAIIDMSGHHNCGREVCK